MKLSLKERKLVLEYAKKLVDKRKLTEESKPSYAQTFRDWCISKGLKVDMGHGPHGVMYLLVTKNGKDILSKKTNSFFRSDHLDSFANQISKKLGIENDFKAIHPKPQKIGDVINRYTPKFIEYIIEIRDTLAKTEGFSEGEIRDYLIQLVSEQF